jgi:hypothetical protein
LDIGREGGVTIEKNKGQWGWSWLKEERGESVLSVEEGVLLFPACRTPEVNIDDLPASKVADSAVGHCEPGWSLDS